MQTLEYNQLIIAELFDAQPDSVVWFKPIWAAGEKEKKKELVDFEASYCNNAACTFYNASKEDIVATRLVSSEILNNTSNPSIFKQYAEVLKTGKVQESTYYNERLGKYYNILQSKVREGVLVVSRENTGYYTDEKEFERRARKYSVIIDSSADGILLLDAVRGKDGSIKDFRIAHCNKVALHLGRISSNASGKSLLRILPHLKDSEQFELHKKVVDTGIPIQFETSFRNEKGEEYGWFIVSLMKLEDGVLSRFVDITENKKNEQSIEKQAEFLNSILEASINGIFVCEAIRDIYGKIADLMMVKINGAFTQMIGKTVQEVEGKTYLSLFPTAKSSGLFDINCHVIETNQPVRKEVYYKGEGLNAWYDISSVKLGKDGLVVSFTDITERKLFYTEIEQQRNLLDSILKHSPSGISVTEVMRDEQGNVTDGRTLLANDAAVQFIGIPKQDYLTKTAREIDPNILDSPLYKLALSTLETGEPSIAQYFLEASTKWLELGVSKMDNDRLVNVFTDISDSKQAQLQLEKLVEELKRSNANLEEFTHAASHDLKEPVRKISIFANRLKNSISSVDNPEGIKILERLQTAAERMQLLIDDLLEYSYVNQTTFEFEEIDLNEKLKRVFLDLELVIEEKKAKISTAELPIIKGHGRQIQQLFQNLVSNAVKYSKTGVPPEIFINASEVSGSEIKLSLSPEEMVKKFFLIEITDNGIGFDQMYADRIFNMFQRLHGKNEYSGSGVGLSIVRKVVENHKGYITALSEQDKGSVFKVYLPA